MAYIMNASYMSHQTLLIWFVHPEDDDHDIWLVLIVLRGWLQQGFAYFRYQDTTELNLT